MKLAGLRGPCETFLQDNKHILRLSTIRLRDHAQFITGGRGEESWVYSQVWKATMPFCLPQSLLYYVIIIVTILNVSSITLSIVIRVYQELDKSGISQLWRVWGFPSIEL